MGVSGECRKNHAEQKYCKRMKDEEPADEPRIEIRTGKDHSDHVQLFIFKHGIRNHDEPGRISLLLGLSGQSHGLYRCVSVCHRIVPFCGAGIATIAFTALAMNCRHMFYGVTFLKEFKSMGKCYPYMIFP